ncbi:MAG: hypothetical protein FWH11_00480 [Micrococcales bacterium]|nr:hypothetical protein [Micrococcales bacterium]
MTSPTISRHARWGVPTLAVSAVVAGFALQPLLAAASAADLPETTPEQLVAQVLAADPQPLSGTVVYTADLGLPNIAALAGVAGLNSAMTSADPTNLLAGTSTLKVWTDADSRSRVTLQGGTSEFSVVHDATQAWTYSSHDQTVTHYTVDDPARLAELGQTEVPVPADLPTPPRAADDLLAELGQHSTLTLDATTTVAGRAAYQLVLTPKSTTTLVGRITVAIDGKTFSPLKVAVWSRDDAQNPAVELGFTDVTFATPSDQVLTWSTPAGAQVEEVVVPLPTDAEIAEAAAEAQDLAPTVTVSGTGWDQVVTITGLPVDELMGLPGTGPDRSAHRHPLPGLAQDYAQMPEEAPQIAQSLLAGLSTEVDGGRLISSSLVNVLLLDDGRVLVGAVPGDTLLAAAR